MLVLKVGDIRKALAIDLAQIEKIISQQKK